MKYLGIGELLFLVRMLEVRLKNGSPTEPVEIVCTIHIYFLMTAIQRSNVVSQSVCHVMIRSNIKQWVSFLCSANQSASQTVLTGILLQGNTGYFTECFLQPSQLQQIRGQTWPSLSHRNEEYSLGETEKERERLILSRGRTSHHLPQGRDKRQYWSLFTDNTRQYHD